MKKGCVLPPGTHSLSTNFHSFLPSFLLTCLLFLFLLSLSPYNHLFFRPISFLLPLFFYPLPLSIHPFISSLFIFFINSFHSIYKYEFKIFCRQDIHSGTKGAGGVHIRDSKEALAYLGSKGFFPILSSQESVVQPR